MDLPILRFTQREYAAAIQSALGGKGRDHARFAWAEWFRTGEFVGGSAAFANAERLKEGIRAATDWSLPAVTQVIPAGDTVKFLLDTGSESVALPMPAGWTLCLSSQIGCAMGCAFCETGTMGLKRHLKAEEIVAQVFIAQHQLHKPIRNVVFMGMGEPLDNYDEVLRAVRVLIDPAGFGLGARHITISTSGRVEEIYRLIEDADPSLNLAVSVNAPSDGVRQKIMPINRKYDMAALYQAMAAYCQHPRRMIFAEYVMLAGVNDSLEAADELAEYLRGLKVKVNLIPYNSQRRTRFAAPPSEGVEAFAARLRQHGYVTLVRQTKGERIMAACGQLGGRLKEERLSIVGFS